MKIKFILTIISLCIFISLVDVRYKLPKPFQNIVKCFGSCRGIHDHKGGLTYASSHICYMIFLFRLIKIFTKTQTKTVIKIVPDNAGVPLWVMKPVMQSRQTFDVQLIAPVGKIYIISRWQNMKWIVFSNDVHKNDFILSWVYRII